MRLILHWILSAVALMIVAHIVPGIAVRGFGWALVAAVVIGLVNATLGSFLKLVTLPLTLLTLGLFWLIINALMLRVASWIVPGFVVMGFWPAFWGAILLALLNVVIRGLLPRRDH
jgi:putative membrane protein